MKKPKNIPDIIANMITSDPDMVREAKSHVCKNCGYEMEKTRLGYKCRECGSSPKSF